MKTPLQLLAEILTHTKFGWHERMLELVQEYADRYADNGTDPTASEKAHLLKMAGKGKK